MKKIRTLTFHSSYNYGSNLQAYALQEFIKKIFDNRVDYKIINLRTKQQKNIYNTYKNFTLKNLVKRIIFKKYKKQLVDREKNFEKFINERLMLTKEIVNTKDIKKISADYLIFGSDQIWNYNAHDFVWEYFGCFETKAKKISYAASIGPQKNNVPTELRTKIQNCLKDFKCISVREEGTKKFLHQEFGINSQINVDPTFLIKKEEWESEISKDRIIKEKYILLYDLYGNKDSLEISKIIQEKTKLPVYVIKNHYIEYFKYDFKKYYECGPLEFLNIIKNSEFVISSSFHGTVFSIIFNKPFFAVNGMKDIRISNILKKYSLQDRSITLENINDKLKKIYDVNFKESNVVIKKDIEEAKEYLLKSLN